MNYLKNLKLEIEFFITDIDDCQGVECKNNGTCMDHVLSFTCQCLTGYTEQYCQSGRNSFIVFTLFTFFLISILVLKILFLISSALTELLLIVSSVIRKVMHIQKYLDKNRIHSKINFFAASHMYKQLK